ncbi:MAG: hypothetical protein ABJ004_07930 [Cyclobacteriaceae bacterium]
MKAILALLCLFTSAGLMAQTTDTTSQVKEVESLVSFYKYLLNTVGSEKTSQRDKEVIITESYKKIFRDDQVQIEDDLDPERVVVTNKNVKAYLQDVDFFFRDIHFDFENVDVEKQEGDLGLMFYKVSFTSVLSGANIEGLKVSQSTQRFIEVNYNEDADDLKIVSIYTTKIDREKELRLWWETLSLSWKELLRAKVSMPIQSADSVDRAFLMAVAKIDSLDLDEGEFFLDINPVSNLRNLKYLDISGTSVFSLEPARVLADLQYLDASGTIINDIQSLRYCQNLTHLNLSSTHIDDISTLRNFPKLTYLDLSSTYVTDFSTLLSLKNLEELQLSNVSIQNNLPFNGLLNLRVLNLSNTHISEWLSINLQAIKTIDLSGTPLKAVGSLYELETLEVLKLNNTQIESISELAVLPILTKLYCDNTKVSEEQASEFMDVSPKAIVLTNADELKNWWESLSDNWKDELRGQSGFTAEPTQEELVRLVNIDSLDLEGKNLLDGSPLSKFTRLQYLNISGNLFTDIEFVSDLRLIKTLMASGLPVDDLSPLSDLNHLEVLILRTKTVEDISALSKLKPLRLIDVDSNRLIDSDVIPLISKSQAPVIIYRTEELQAWWESLDDGWSTALKQVNAWSASPSPKQLHELTQSEELVISNHPIANLSPLNVFINLKSLKISYSRVQDLKPLSEVGTIEQLEITYCPLEDLEPINSLKGLRVLNVSNTSVKTLKPFRELKEVTHIDASGTNIKNLKGLSELYQLESLNLSNTRVWKLDRLTDIPDLKEIICFNTRLRQHKVDEYQSLNPECKITFY